MRDYMEYSGNMLDSSTLQPWVELVSHDQGDRILIHDPYKQEDKNVQLGVLTTICLQRKKDKCIAGIYTTLIHGSQDPVIRLDLQRSDYSPHQSPGKPDGTGSATLIDCQDRFLHQICLRFSEAIFIIADNFHQAIKELFHLVDAVEIDDAQHRRWPKIVVVVSSSCKRAPFCRVHWRGRASFAQSALTTWSQLGRFGGKYTRVLQTLLDRTQVWASIPTGTTMVHEVQSILASHRRYTPDLHTLGDIMTKMERFCMDPPLPRAIESRAQYWPGKGHLVHSSLINWFHQVDGDTITTNHIACICAQLFLRDSEFVVPGEYNPNRSRKRLMPY